MMQTPQTRAETVRGVMNWKHIRHEFNSSGRLVEKASQEGWEKLDRRIEMNPTGLARDRSSGNFLKANNPTPNISQNVRRKALLPLLKSELKSVFPDSRHRNSTPNSLSVNASGKSGRQTPTPDQPLRDEREGGRILDYRNGDGGNRPHRFLENETDSTEIFRTEVIVGKQLANKTCLMTGSVPTPLSGTALKNRSQLFWPRMT